MSDWFASYFALGNLQLEQALDAQHDPLLVIASLIISGLGAYAALRIAACVRLTEARFHRLAWFAAGAITMGVSVWAMHFIGMLAFQLPIPVSYDLWLTLLSVCPAILAGALMLQIATKPNASLARIAIGGTAMGLGVVVMHYSGMAAMRLEGVVLYNPLIFALSVVVSIALAIAALFANLRIESAPKIVPAGILGAAVSGMHYTAMSATLCFASGNSPAEVGGIGTNLLSALIIIAVLALIGLAIFVTYIDQRLNVAAANVLLNRNRLLDAIESTSDGFAFFDADDLLEICNQKFHHLVFGSSEGRVELGTPFESIIRKAAELGHIKHDGDIEAVVRERVERHRSPGEPLLQLRGDGRWLLISERRASDGGVVAVYSDVTQLKANEIELANKTRSLEHLSNQLAKYLSPQVYSSIFSGEQDVKVDSKRKKLTVFFSDLVDFTETTERLASEELTKLLNHYFTEMSQIALDHGATVDKFIGDALMVFFGDPGTRGVKQDALACVKMAIAMRDRLEELAHDWKDIGIEKPFRARFGIHTDYCTVGNFGSESRVDYTVIGAGVNLAARVESAAAPGEILISFETYSHVKDQVECSESKQISVKGVSHPVNVYSVIGERHQQTSPSGEQNLATEHLSLRLDIDSMNDSEKLEARGLLNKALGLLGAPSKTRRD